MVEEDKCQRLQRVVTIHPSLLSSLLIPLSFGRRPCAVCCVCGRLRLLSLRNANSAARDTRPNPTVQADHNMRTL